MAGLGGTFAPTWYDTPAADLPHPRKGTARATVQADRRRHFVREEVVACQSLSGSRRVPDARSGAAVLRRRRRPDAGWMPGKTPINEVLAVMKPRLHLFGHHHRFSEQERQGVRSVGTRSSVIDTLVDLVRDRPGRMPVRADAYEGSAGPLQVGRC